MNSSLPMGGLLRREIEHGCIASLVWVRCFLFSLWRFAELRGEAVEASVYISSSASISCIISIFFFLSAELVSLADGLAWLFSFRPPDSGWMDGWMKERKALR